jgi:hypothetical protein
MFVLLNMKNKSKKSVEVINIIENATVVYTDGVREQFEVVRQTDKGVIIGRIIDGELVDCGFISKNNIKQINDGNMKQVKRAR